MDAKRKVFVVVRHTRSGDQRAAVLDNRDDAMHRAEGITDAAARDYGHGSASVFPATLTITGKAIRPRKSAAPAPRET